MHANNSNKLSRYQCSEILVSVYVYYLNATYYSTIKIAEISFNTFVSISEFN